MCVCVCFKKYFDLTDTFKLSKKGQKETLSIYHVEQICSKIFMYFERAVMMKALQSSTVGEESALTGKEPAQGSINHAHIDITAHS